MNRNIRRIFAVVLLFLLTFCGCADNSGEDTRPALTVWVFSDNHKTVIERATASALTSVDWRLDVHVVGVDEVSRLLSGESASSAAAPDVFMLSPDLLPAFVNSDITADLGALGIVLDDTRYYSYTIDAGTSGGVLKAACYEPDPGLFFYRRSLASYYLGTDDPARIQDMISDWEGFYQTALKLYEASEGVTRMAMGVEELMMAYLSDVSLVSDGRLYVGDEALDFMAYCNKMASAGLIYNAQQWSDAWVAGISDPQSVFGYFSSGLGMEHVLKPCCGGSIPGEGSYGDWAAVPGPESFNWGGCWFAVHSSSKMKDAASEFIGYFVCEEEAMRTNSLISGLFSANRTVVEQIKFDSQFSESFLSAQNCYGMMAQSADRISMSSGTEYDTVINPLFARFTADYAFGYSSLEQALSDFERSVGTACPDLAS